MSELQEKGKSSHPLHVSSMYKAWGDYFDLGTSTDLGISLLQLQDDSNHDNSSTAGMLSFVTRIIVFYSNSDHLRDPRNSAHKPLHTTFCRDLWPCSESHTYASR